MVGLLVPADPCPPVLTKSFAEAAQTVSILRPQTVVAVSAAWRTRGFSVGAGLPLHADGLPAEFPPDQQLVERIIEEAISAGLPAATEPCLSDSATLPALMRLLPERTGLVMLGVPLASPALLQEFGQAAARAARELGRNILTIAVGGITHHHNADPDDPAIGTFVDLVLAHLQQGEGDRLFEIDGATWISARPDADLGHLAVLLGATGPDAEGETLGVERRGGIRSAVVQLRGTVSPPWLSPSEWSDTQRAGGL